MYIYMPMYAHVLVHEHITIYGFMHVYLTIIYIYTCRYVCI